MPINVFLSHTPARHYLREWREKRGLSQEELGKKCGTSGPSISHYEKGNRGLPLELLLKLLEHLDILPGQFFAPPETPSLDAYANFMTAHELGHLLSAVETAIKLEPKERMALLVAIRRMAAERLSPESPQSTRDETV
jgi:transcriptional regulator with XRE-family HTH domain